VRVRGATKTEVGAINEPVVVGGTMLVPGDIVLLDADGAVAIPAARAADVLRAARAREEREAALREKLRAGAFSYDLHGLRAIVDGRKEG
jgi:4-hydroxy-4-methyl-2-oxoglutarate aldolase